jgi:hypothetical protein
MQDTVKKTVRFRSEEDYPAVVKALKGLGGNLISDDLDRKGGYLHLVVQKGTSLETFEKFQEGPGKSMDRHLKVRLVPYTKEGKERLRQIFHGFVLGDYAEVVAKHTYTEGEHLTVRFSDHGKKTEFVSRIKADFPGDITVRG